MAKVLTFLSMSTRQKWFISKMVILLPLYQLCVWLLPLRWLIKIFKLKQTSQSQIEINHPTEKGSDVVQEVAWTIRTVTRALPWLPGACFAQALCARSLLLKHKIHSTLFLGANLDGEDTSRLKAHSWLLVDQITVCGEDEKHRYQEIASFT